MEVAARAEAEGFMEEAEGFGADRREDSAVAVRVALAAAVRAALAVAAVTAVHLAGVRIVAHQVMAMGEAGLSLGQRIAAARTEAVTAAERTAERTVAALTARIEDRHFPPAGILEMRPRVRGVCVAAWLMGSGIPLQDHGDPRGSQDRGDLRASQAREVLRMARPLAFATRALAQLTARGIPSGAAA